MFREGHDAVAASVVWRSPDGSEAPFNRMRPLGGGTDRWRAEVVAEPGRHLDLRGRGVERSAGDLVPRGRGEEPRPARRRPSWPTTSRSAPGCSSRWRKRIPSRPSSAEAVAADLRSETEDVPLRITRAMGRGAWRWPTTIPVRELITRSPRYSVWVDRAASAVRGLVRVLPALDRGRTGRRPGRPGPPASARHLRRRHQAPGLRGRPRTSTWSTCRRSIRSARVNRKGPNNTLRRQARPTPARHGRSVRPRAATTRSIPNSATRRTSPRSWPGPGNWAWRSRSTWRCNARRIIRGSKAPGMVHHAARRHHRLRRESPEEVPGHLPAQLRQRPGRAGRARCCGSPCCGSSAG